jgi:hypothetical protein
MSAFNPLGVNSPVVHQPNATVSPDRTTATTRGARQNPHQDQQDADQKRLGLTPTSDPAVKMREPRVAPQRGIHAERNADHERQQRGGGGSSSVAGSRSLSSVNGSPLAQRAAEIALERVTDEVRRLDHCRLVRAPARRATSPFFDGRVLPDHEDHRSPVKLNNPNAINATTPMTAMDWRMRRQDESGCMGSLRRPRRGRPTLPPMLPKPLGRQCRRLSAAARAQWFNRTPALPCCAFSSPG